MALREAERVQARERARLQHRRGQLYAVGRVLVAALFLVSAGVKAASFEETRRALGSLGLSDGTWLLSVALLIELVGGAMLAAGCRARTAAAALVAYLAAVTVLVHGDWSQDLNRAFALANLACAGALLMIVAHGAGVHSVDRHIERRRAASSVP